MSLGDRDFETFYLVFEEALVGVRLFRLRSAMEAGAESIYIHFFRADI